MILATLEKTGSLEDVGAAANGDRLGFVGLWRAGINE